MRWTATRLARLVLSVTAFYWLADYIRRRRRARELYKRAQERVPRVGVRDVIAREQEDELVREELMAKLPLATRYYDRRRYEMAWQFLPETLRGARILDAGCGDGYILQELDKVLGARSVRFFGADISHYKCVRARERLGPGVPLATTNLESLPYCSQAFDVIICTEVLEHLLKVGPGIAELWRVLAPNGILIFSTPSRHAAFFSFANPLTWLEAGWSVWEDSVLPPFHNLERPLDPNSVVHRAFTIQELRRELRAFSDVTIATSQYRLPGFFYRVAQARGILEQIETFLARVPVVNRLGQTLIVRAVKEGRVGQA